MEIFFPILTFIVSYILFHLFIKNSRKIRLISTQHILSNRNERIPTSGGIVFALVFCLSTYILSPVLSQNLVYSIITGSGFLALLGFMDDKYNLSALIKLLFQIIFVIYVGYTLEVTSYYQHSNYLAESFLYILFTILGVWILNTFNFIDGADGLLSTNILIISIIISMLLLHQGQIYLSITLLILASINLAFLLFNWSPAKIFMGDSGSLFLGSLFIIFPVYTIINLMIPIWTWLILMSILYVETTVTLISRIIDKKDILKERHNYHAYQQLILKYSDHSKPARVSIFIQIILVLPLSVISYTYNSPLVGLITSVLIIVPMIFVFYFFGPREARKKE